MRLGNRFEKQTMTALKVARGSSAHLGATVTPEGVSFCVYSKFATGVELLLFDREDAADPCQIVELNGPDREQ
jgi:glycogen operon protein